MPDLSTALRYASFNDIAVIGKTKLLSDFGNCLSIETQAGERGIVLGFPDFVTLSLAVLRSRSTSDHLRERISPRRVADSSAKTTTGLIQGFLQFSQANNSFVRSLDVSTRSRGAPCDGRLTELHGFLRKPYDHSSIATVNTWLSNCISRATVLEETCCRRLSRQFEITSFVTAAKEYLASGERSRLLTGTCHGFQSSAHRKSAGPPE